MKQIVVNGGETYGRLLTPKWIVEYYKRKGVELFVYIPELTIEDDYMYELKDPNELDDNTCVYCPLYLLDNFGDIIEEITDEIAQKVVYSYDMFNDREDKTLISIAKEINNEDLIKIIEIPDDVEYDIVESDCGFGEWVEEKHRVWH